MITEIQAQMTPKEKNYKSKQLDFEKILPHLQTLSEKVESIKKTDREHHFKGDLLGGGSFFVKIFKNNDGSITLGKATGVDAYFEKVADSIISACSFSQLLDNIEYSIPKFSSTNFTNLCTFLKEDCKAIENKSTGTNYTQIRFTGSNKDTLSLKYYSNETLQIQGKFAYLASAVDDFLRNVLAFDDFLTHQLAIYKVDIPLITIKHELTAVIPFAHAHIAENVRSLFSSALALSKIEISVEEYSFVAFPALRGLEGVTFDLLCKFFNCKPTRSINLGEYFDKNGALYELRSIYRGTKSPDLCLAVAQCYNLWQAQRHGLFHMDGTVETTRMLRNIADARAITNAVFRQVDSCYQTLSTRGLL